MTDELHDDDEPLIPLAARIADGEAVDWQQEVERVSESDRATLDALREIADIESAHRSAQQSFEAEPAPAPARWRHLTILEEIGVGRFGRVSRAYDNTLQIEVALKLSLVGDSGSLDSSRVLREARQLAKVHHPNVVQVYGADYCDGRAGIWMDLVRGRTLEQILKEQRFGAAEAANVGIQLARALAAVHGEHVLHGDIKPHNVVRRENGDFVLVDFGASETLPEPRGSTGEIVGTLCYMAPEVLSGGARSRASDIYALGVLLFRLVTDTYPVFATSIDQALDAHRSGRRQRLRDLRPDLPASFIQAVERATSPDPAARFSSAGALEAALLDKDPPPPDPVRSSWWRGAAILVLAGAIGGGVWTMVPTRTDKDISQPAPAPGTSRPDADDPPIATAPGSLHVDASFYRVGADVPERLDATKAFRRNDRFYLTARVSAPTHLYVVDEDESGKAFLLFPLPQSAQTNPIPANQVVRVPTDFYWEVNSAGGREHLMVFASTVPLEAFDDAFRRLPAPRVDASADAPQEPLSETVLEQLRGVGRLTPVSDTAPVSRPTFWQMFDKPLNGPETAPVPWIRQLTLTNSSK